MINLLGLRETFLSEITEQTFFSMFFFMRWFCLPCFMLIGWTCPSVNIVQLILCCGMIGRSIGEGRKMLVVFKGRFDARAERAKKKIPFYWFTPTSKEVLETCDYYLKHKKKNIKLN